MKFYIYNNQELLSEEYQPEKIDIERLSIEEVKNIRQDS